MPDSPVDHSLASEAAAGASAGSIPRSCNIFYSFFLAHLLFMSAYNAISSRATSSSSFMR